MIDQDTTGIKKKIVHSKKILFQNINSLNEKLYAKSFNLNKKKLKLKKILKLDNANFICFLFLDKIFTKYYSACNFRLKKYFH